MKLWEHGRLERVRKSRERAEIVRKLVGEGECVKRAAWKAGVSQRQAYRYREFPSLPQE